MKEDLFPDGILLVSIHGKIYGQMDDLEKLQSSSGDDHPRTKTTENACEDKEPFQGF